MQQLPHKLHFRMLGLFSELETVLPNAIVAEAIEKGKIPELAGYESLRREVKYGKNSRIDILLEDPEKGLCYVEIKNVTMRRNLKDGPLEFPDGVTSRGAKHLVELADMVAEGHRAVMLYLVQRGDGDRFDGVGDGGSPRPSPVAASWSKGVKNQKMSNPSHGAATTASTSFFFGHRLSVSYSPNLSPNSWSIA